jgi:uncharacterized protein YndB with AHSA1/START domain
VSEKVPEHDRARVTMRVAVPQETAFRVFTSEMNAWWLSGRAYRVGGRGAGTIAMEPRLGGRLIETYEVGGKCKTIEMGRVTAWEPPTRVVFDWRAVNFVGDERTEVEVVFEPSDDGTLVTVTHRGWSKIRPDHPVRHGQAPIAFFRMMGEWWGALLKSLDRSARSLPRSAGPDDVADPRDIAAVAARLDRAIETIDDDGYRKEIIAAAVRADDLVIAWVETRSKTIGSAVDITIKIHRRLADGREEATDIESHNPYFGCDVHTMFFCGDSCVLVYREKNRTYAARFGDVWPPVFKKIEHQWSIVDGNLTFSAWDSGIETRLSLPSLEPT